MPVSIRGTPYYTKEQIDYIKNNVGVYEYCLSRGYPMKRQGSNIYCLDDHDSLKIFLDSGRFYWYSRGIGGDAISFLREYEGLSMIEAVSILSNDTEVLDVIYRGKSYEKRNNINYTRKDTIEQAEEKDEYISPQKAEKQNEVYSYLCGKRKIDIEIVKFFRKSEKIYMSKKDIKRTDGTSFSSYNLTFSNTDITGKEVGAAMRSTRENIKWHGIEKNSDRNYGFSYTPKETNNTLRVYESAIDMLSHMTLAKLTNKTEDDWKLEHRLAINGVTNFQRIEQYLKDHPDIKRVVFCYDNDYDKSENIGQVTAKQHAEKLKERGYICFKNVPYKKDFNEDLIETVKNNSKDIINEEETKEQVLDNLSKETILENLNEKNEFNIECELEN